MSGSMKLLNFFQVDQYEKCRFALTKMIYLSPPKKCNLFFFFKNLHEFTFLKKDWPILWKTTTIKNINYIIKN